MPTNRESFLDVGFDVLALDALVSRVASVSADSKYQYLVTPNVDHMVRLHKQGEQIPELAEAYRDADLCVCDSKVLARLAKWRNLELPVIPGSDLVELMFQGVIARGDRLAVIGGDDSLLRGLQARYPHVEFVQHCPPMGLMRNPAARREAANFIANSKARFAFICVGSPQQELIAAEAAKIDGARGLALCIGAALEFLTGDQKRAPVLARRLGLEWAHRLLTNPRRLWKRYLVDGPAIFVLAYRWRRSAV
ncbi:WecB/TagA/CpsF family glycosyltransferase [Sphingomonas sp. SM33]|uniref:WecB/TagA/CpsF family glycosyltransferase n=1 Tax=Sphingomonas telluris TaxID=2907998 RepID=A0ABS9VI84_9SPHN|nr:WecB/TagA/CpsF family glycosyltransferase [Sphingomonas telluris]MCH8614680.1 WecB/TagA/CpsF family glycosyltransferase [Sphingomonas telluris]